jgi:hypothetical protein
MLLVPPRRSDGPRGVRKKARSSPSPSSPSPSSCCVWWPRRCCAAVHGILPIVVVVAAAAPRGTACGVLPRIVIVVVVRLESCVVPQVPSSGAWGVDLGVGSPLRGCGGRSEGGAGEG